MSLKPSRRLFCGVAVVTCLLALLCIVAIISALGINGLSVLLAVAYLCLLVGHWMYFLRSQSYQQGVLEMQADSWCWQAQHTSVAVLRDWCIVGDVVLWSWLIVLPLGNRNSGQRIRLVILADSTSLENQRKLRVYLKTRYWKSSAGH